MRWFCGLLLLFALSCKKDKPTQPETEVLKGQSVFVLNEGNFMWGNASLSHINLSTSQIREDVFSAHNQRPVGDVLNSSLSVNGQLWLIVNNSQKIERLNETTLQALEPISGLHSPRFAAHVAAGKVYVTDLYANKIHIINETSATLTGHIPVSGWTEGIVVSQGWVWVCNTGADVVYKIDPSEDRIVDSIEVGDNPRNIVADASGKIWVLCEGNIPPQESAGSLWKIDPTNLDSVLSFAHAQISDHPSRLCISPQGDFLYWIKDGVFRMAIQQTALPTGPFIPADGRLFYGLGISPIHDIFVSDAKDYVQKGKVYRYSADGLSKGSWDAGIIPGGFHFY